MQTSQIHLKVEFDFEIILKNNNDSLIRRNYMTQKMIDEDQDHYNDDSFNDDESDNDVRNIDLFHYFLNRVLFMIF